MLADTGDIPPCVEKAEDVSETHSNDVVGHLSGVMRF